MKRVNTAVKKAGDSTTQNVQPKVKDLNNFKKEKLEVVGKKKEEVPVDFSSNKFRLERIAQYMKDLQNEGVLMNKPARKEKKIQEKKPPVPQKQISEEEMKFALGKFYLDKVLHILSANRREEEEDGIPVGTVYEGFKTIPIQKLERMPQPKLWMYEAGSKAWAKKKGDNVLCFKESCQQKGCARNGFFQTLYLAYVNHGDLKLTPDDVWLPILIYFSKYVNDHAKELQQAFVKHEGKLNLVVEVDTVDESDWDEFFEEMIKLIRQATVEDVTENLECNFSSTNQFSLMMSTAVIMNSFKKYFNYVILRGGCGIVNVHMGGNLKDWQKIEKKLAFLRQFDVDGQLKKYVDRLLPVVEQFTETYKGEPKIHFWNNIYNERKNPSEGYVPPYIINGWLLRFFTLEEVVHFRDDASMSVINVPITQMNVLTGEKKELKLVGGCKGISIEDEFVYRPHYSFAIIWNPEEEKKAN